MPNVNGECVCVNPQEIDVTYFVFVINHLMIETQLVYLDKNMLTSLGANCTFRTYIYTILLHRISQLKEKPKSLFNSLNPIQNNNF